MKKAQARLIGLMCVALTLGLGVYADDPLDHDSPRQTLRLHFWHHSTGDAWLSNGLRDALKQVMWNDNGTMRRTYMVSDYGYGGQNDYTDWRNWYPRFRFEVGIPGGNGKNYVFHKPQTAENEILPANFMLTAYNYTRQSGETMKAPEQIQVLMIKPCFPGSELYSYDTQFDSQGRVIGGTPWSDSNHSYTNFDYLDSTPNPSQSYGTTYWPAKPGVSHSGGSWGGPAASLAQLKVALRGMLSVFHEHPEVIFVLVQAPPMTALTAENTASDRELARWFRDDFLHQWDPTGKDQFQDYQDKSGRNNVRSFDYYNAIAYTGDDSRLDSRYAWFPADNLWPDDFNDWDGPARFVEPGLGTNVPLTSATADFNQPRPPTREIGESRDMDDDSHPSSYQHYHATDIFVGLTRNPGSKGYRSWINAMVNNWLKADLIQLSVTRIGAVGVRLSWTSYYGASYDVYGGPDPQHLSWLTTQNSLGSTTTWDDPNPAGNIKYYHIVKR